jgi:hypothetical protein
MKVVPADAAYQASRLSALSVVLLACLSPSPLRRLMVFIWTLVVTFEVMGNLIEHSNPSFRQLSGQLNGSESHRSRTRITGNFLIVSLYGTTCKVSENRLSLIGNHW